MFLKAAVAIAFLALNLYAYRFFATEDVIPPRESFDQFSLEQGRWKCEERKTMTDEVISTLGVTDYLLCDFNATADPDSDEANSPVQFINVYAGYHERQIKREGGKESVIHPPEHCLPGSGWNIIESSIVPIDFGIPGEAKRVVIARGEQRQVSYFWYQSRGRVLAHGMEKIVYMFSDRISSGRSDGSLVRFTIPIGRGTEEAADEAFYELAAQLIPQFEPSIPN